MMRALLSILMLCLIATSAEARYQPLELKQYEWAQRKNSKQQFLFLHDENHDSYVHLCADDQQTACGGARDGTYRTVDNVTFIVYRGLLESPTEPTMFCDYVRNGTQASLACESHD